MKPGARRKAGSPEFQSGMNEASKPRGGGSRDHLNKGPSLIGGSSTGGGRSHMNKGPELIGGNSWNKQVHRESRLSDNDAATGSYGAKNMQEYINVSKSATQGNADFSIDNANKYTNNARGQSQINKEENKGFSDNRINNNTEFANAAHDRAAKKNEGFAMGVTNNFINNAKAHREDNTRKAQQFATQTVGKYMSMNKGNQATDVKALDKTIRSQPIVDQAYSNVQGKNTYGDMFSYGRNGLPGWGMPTPMPGVESPDVDKIGSDWRDSIGGLKIKS